MVTKEQPDLQQDQDDQFPSDKNQPESRSALPLGSIYSEEEALFLGPWQTMRQRILRPIACGLSRLGISANILSYTSVLFGLGFCLLAPFYFDIAFWLLAASVVCDGLDGVEARYTHTNNARGSFTDMFCDVTVVALCVAGVAWKGLIHPALAIIFIYCYTALDAFLLLHRMLRVSTTGILRPSRNVFFIAIAVYFFFQINLLNLLLILYLPALVLLFLSFWRLRKAL